MVEQVASLQRFWVGDSATIGEPGDSRWGPRPRLSGCDLPNRARARYGARQQHMQNQPARREREKARALAGRPGEGRAGWTGSTADGVRYRQ